MQKEKQACLMTSIATALCVSTALVYSCPFHMECMLC